MAGHIDSPLGLAMNVIKYYRGTLRELTKITFHLINIPRMAKLTGV